MAFSTLQTDKLRGCRHCDAIVEPRVRKCAHIRKVRRNPLRSLSYLHENSLLVETGIV